MRARLADAAAAIDADLPALYADWIWEGAAIDSRKVAEGQLFFALEGSRTDGHAFVAAALGAGARAAVVNRTRLSELPQGSPLLAVDDVEVALHALTRWGRARTPRKLVGVTGSVGKTTTKEVLAALLAERFRTAKSPGNLNNLFGFPLALLGIDEDVEWLVAEMGMSSPGELGKLSRLARPDIAVVTSVRPVHMEFFGTLRAIGDAKGEILEGLSADGVLVVNLDDPEVLHIATRWPGRKVTYGLSEGDVHVSGIEDRGGSGARFRLHAGSRDASGSGSSGDVVVELPLYGRYNIENFLAAAAVAWHAGVSLTEIARGATHAVPASMRGVVRQVDLPGGSATVVDDSYNSNPSAVERALESASRLPGRRHWAVLGEMRELGDDAAAFHRELGARAAAGFSPIVGVGPLARQLVDSAKAAGRETAWYPDAAAAAADLGGGLVPGDVVLVKGSRGVGLEAVVRAFVESGRDQVDGADAKGEVR